MTHSSCSIRPGNHINLVCHCTVQKFSAEVWWVRGLSNHPLMGCVVRRFSCGLSEHESYFSVLSCTNQSMHLVKPCVCVNLIGSSCVAVSSDYRVPCTSKCLMYTYFQCLKQYMGLGIHILRAILFLYFLHTHVDPILIQCKYMYIHSA